MTLFFDNEEYKKRTIDLAIDISQFFDRLEIDYIIDYGTLLGFLRNNDVISHDYDFDISVFANTLNNEKHNLIVNKAKKINSRLEYFFIDKYNKNVPVFYAFVGEDNFEPKVDIYIYFDGIGRNFSGNSKIMTLDKDGKNFYENNPSHYQNRKNIDFVGRKWKIPYKTEEYISSIYGESWRTPINNMYFPHLNFVKDSFIKYAKR